MSVPSFLAGRRMIFQLYDGAWGDIMEALDLLRDSFIDHGISEGADRVQGLMKALEKLGADVMGGKLEGYRFPKTSGHPQQDVEIWVS